MAAMAVSTQRIRMGTMVTPLSRRRPWVMARQIATLDQLSNGRVVVGVGLGDDGWKEFSSFGEETDGRLRGAALDESLAVLRGLLDGAPVSYYGSIRQVDSTPFLPRPQLHPIPIWAAGRWPRRRPLERAAKLQGFFPIFHRQHQSLAPSQSDLSTIQSELRARQVPADYDLVVTWSFAREGDPASLRAEVRRLEEVGVTWALHSLPPTPVPARMVDVAVMSGPPGA